jgi:hypothetical protein
MIPHPIRHASTAEFLYIGSLVALARARLPRSRFER